MVDNVHKFGRDTVVTTSINYVERVGTSKYGNPYYRLFLTTDPFIVRTQIDSALNYGITNTDIHHRPVKLYLTKAGRVYKYEIATEETEEN